MFRNWWPQRADRAARPSRHSRPVGRWRQAFHPALEPLEYRTVPSFLPAVSFPVGVHPRAVTVADLNNDATPDIVAVNLGPFATFESSVSVLLGNGDGSFQPAVTTDVLNSGVALGVASSLAVGDFNGDGLADLVLNSLSVLESEASQLGVLLGNGDSTFQGPVLSSPLPEEGDLALGDFNNDGLTDVAVTLSKLGEPPGGLAVFLGNGDGTFQFPQGFLTGGNDPSGVAAGDLNGDGLVDLAVANIFFRSGDRPSTVGVLINNTLSRPIGTLFTGEQGGVDLDVPFVLSSLGGDSPPPFDVNGGSIVNTDHGPFTLGSGRFTATFGGGGRAFHSGVPELYRFAEGGRNFWGVRGRGVGVITFDRLPAAEVTVFARGTHGGLVSPPEQDLDGDGTTDFRGFGPLGNARAFLLAFSPRGQLVAAHRLDNTALREFRIKGPVSFIVLVNLGEANSFADIAGFTALPGADGGGRSFSAAAGRLNGDDLRHLAGAPAFTHPVESVPARRGDTLAASEWVLPTEQSRIEAPADTTWISVSRKVRPSPAVTVVEDVFTPETA